MKALIVTTILLFTMISNAKAHVPEPPRHVKIAIYRAFGPKYYKQALKVAWCESRFKTTAHNGQYLGLFQMGSYERKLFGHGNRAIEQAKAAYRYFIESGRDWSPWSCKPWLL
jgi:hypothetical protein